MTTREERFRATLRTRTPEREFATLIITRQGMGSAARVWLTFDGAIKTTAVMTDPEAEQLVDLLGKSIVTRSDPEAPLSGSCDGL